MAIVSGPTISGGGVVQTYVDAGSNDANGIAQTLANVISAGLVSSPASYARTNGPAPGIGSGVYTVSTPNSGVSLQAGVGVALVAAGGASAAPGTSVTVAGAGGTGQILLGDNENITFNTGGGTGTVITGDGNNLIGTPVSGSPSGSFNITTGNGNDTIIAAVGSNTVSAGGGNNFTFTGNGTDTINSAGASDTVSGVGGAAGLEDTVYQSSGTVLVGSFAKNLLFVGSNATATVLAGAGSYTVNGGQGANLIAGGSAGNNFLGGGQGSVGSTIFGGGNGDVILARGSGANEVVAGAGNETLTGVGSTGNNIFFTGLGANAATAADSITGGSGNNTFFAGSGQSTINLAGGASDIVAIVNGRAGGAVTLQNFNTSTDQVELQGYAPGTAAAAISQNATLNGGALLTLSDNTQIYFMGVPTVTTSNIS